MAASCQLAYGDTECNLGNFIPRIAIVSNNQLLGVNIYSFIIIIVKGLHKKKI